MIQNYFRRLNKETVMYAKDRDSGFKLQVHNNLKLQNLITYSQIQTTTKNGTTKNLKL